MFWKTYWKNRICHRGFHSYTGKEFAHWVRKYGKCDGQESNGRIDTEISQKDCLARQTRMIDRTMEKLLDSGRYTEENMLVIQNPYMAAPLTAVILFVTEEPCAVRVTVEDGDLFRHTTEETTRHRIPVLSLFADKTNTIQVELLQGECVTYHKKLELVTGALPESLQDAIRIRKKKAESESPFTFVYGGDSAYPYAFDEQGNVRHYLNRRPKSYGVFPLSKGHFLFLSRGVCTPSLGNPHSVLTYEMDFLGRVYREYLVPDGLHHDVCEMEEGGNLMTISSSMSQYVEDSIIEIDRETGEVIQKFCLKDTLSDHPYLDYYDWAHINAVSYQPEDNTILISARNLHSILKIDWGTRELIWILCDTEFWKGTPYEEKVLRPDGEMAFCYQAHAAYFLPEATAKGKRQLIVYDNHWCKRRPVKSFDEDKNSYVRIYEIDEIERTVLLKKSYKTAKSRIRSNGLILNKRVFAMSGCLNKPVEEYQGRITEFNRKSGKVVNEYLTKSAFYRAYPFFADFNELCQPVLDADEKVLGAVPNPELCSGIEFEKALAIPPGDSIRRRFLSPEKRRLAMIRVKFYDDILMVKGKDHLVQKIYFRGKAHSYVQDYSATKQNNPALFGEFVYSVTVGTAVLAPDDYRIYVQAGDQLYDLKKRFHKGEKPVPYGITSSFAVDSGLPETQVQGGFRQHSMG